MPSEPGPKRPQPSTDRPGTLEEILGELRLLRAAVEALTARQQHRAFSETDQALVLAIHETAGSRLFSAAELVDHAQLTTAGGLRDAIASAVGALNARKVGKALRRLEGQELAGLLVVRVGADREGAIWNIARVQE